MDYDIQQTIEEHFTSGEDFTYFDLYELCGARENVKKLCEFYATRLPPYGFYVILIRMNLVLYAIKRFIEINYKVNASAKWGNPIMEIIRYKNKYNFMRNKNRLYFTTLWTILCMSQKYGAIPKKLPQGTISLVKKLYIIARNAEIDDVFEISYTSIL